MGNLSRKIYIGNSQSSLVRRYYFWWKVGKMKYNVMKLCDRLIYDMNLKKILT